MKFLLSIFFILFLYVLSGGQKGNCQDDKVLCSSPEIIYYDFDGNLGNMIDRLGNRWFQDFIDANPFALEMFHIKDREPKHPEKMMWWAGEYLGKHLLGGISLYKMSGDPQLKKQIEDIIQKLIDAQDQDGYWGPFPEKERLYANNWDVWGQYHLELAFLEWYELTKDEKILQPVVKNADYFCRHFLHDKPITQVTWKEMNYAIIHSMGKLYRITENKEYLDLMYQVLEGLKMDDSGDYFELGIKNQPFYTSRKPRWEALHPIQGLVELYYITGNEKYKKSYLNLMESIRDYDIHNTGAFSTEEQAIGTPFEKGPIETCCQVAWNAMQTDAINLTADSRIADELEIGLYNAIMAYTHPSCYWCTYDTPMDGVKRPAVQDIGWQGCEGGPWLNCCTANFTRGFGMLSKWALVTDKSGNLYINFYGSFKGKINIGNNSITINQQTNYPAQGHVKIDIQCSSKFDNEIKFRIPYWSKKVTVRSGKETEDATGQGYFSVKGNGAKKFSIELDVDMERDPLIGDGLYSGKASLYYGPVLLAYDQKFNAFDQSKLGHINYSTFKLGKVALEDALDETSQYKPLMLFKVRNMNGKEIVLCDFASAGSHGTYYKTWLNIEKAPPANVRVKSPLNNSVAKMARFQWSGARSKDTSTNYDLTIATDENFENVVANIKGIKTTSYIVKELLAPGDYYCKVIPKNKYGSGDMTGKPPHFMIEKFDVESYSDPSLYEFRSGDSLIVGSCLDGNEKTVYGHLETVSNIHAAEDRFGNANKSVRFDGTGKIVYSLPYMPDKYSVVCWVKPEGESGSSYIVSGWSSLMDDPLRITFYKKSIVAGIENRNRSEIFYKDVELNKWYHLAMVYNGTQLCLYVNGEKIGKTEKIIYFTKALNFCLGGSNNPDGKCFSGCIDDFAMYAKEFNPEEIRKIYTQELELNSQ